MVEDKNSQKKKQVMIFIGVLLSLIIVTIGASFFSKPGDGTYPIHSFIESSRLYFISSDVEKAKFRLTLADSRLEDMQELLKADSARAAGFAQDEFSNQIIEVQKLAKKMNKTDKKMIDEEVFKRLKTFSQVLGFDDDIEDAEAKSSSDVMDSEPVEE